MKKVIIWVLSALTIFALTGLVLFFVVQNTQKCPSGTMTNDECLLHCENSDNFACVPTDDETIFQSCYACEELKDVKIPVPQDLCPTGSTSVREICDDQCVNGLCSAEVSIDGVECFSCIQCPDETMLSQQSCDATCDQGCEITAQDKDVSCWQCPAACQDRCVAEGFKVQEDYSQFIAAKILPHTCVSGASISIATASIGSCKCTRNPEITIDERVPVCTKTPCGDIECGKKTECMNGKLEVECVWMGWEKVDTNQFRPGIQTHIIEIQ